MTRNPTENNFFISLKLMTFFQKFLNLFDSLNWYGSLLSIQKASQKI